MKSCASKWEREMALIVERLEWRKGGVQAEESVQVEDLILRDGDAGTHLVVILFPVGNHDVEPVGRAALENDHEALAWRETRRCLGQDRPNQKAGNGRGAGDGKSAVAQKESTIGQHCAPTFYDLSLPQIA
jgi:hypothetical protein